ncbi:MAG TPA: hypothetical protein VJI15_03615 [Candidatus Nanoarchaeia archaeon]|nr:hypothetical protein [Candidatus Nanoarchaeia archaeon]
MASDVHVRIDRRLVAQSNLLFDLIHEAERYLGFRKDDDGKIRLTKIVTTEGDYTTIGLFGSIGWGETRESAVVFYDRFADDYKMMRNGD